MKPRFDSLLLAHVLEHLSSHDAEHLVRTRATSGSKKS